MKVYCENCKHYNVINIFNNSDNDCHCDELSILTKETFENHPIKCYTKCEVNNKNNDCKYFNKYVEKKIKWYEKIFG